MNTRFYNAKLLRTREDHTFYVEQGELWVEGSRISYIGDGTDAGEQPAWDREIDVCGNLLMPGFKDAHTHTAMTFLRSYADDLPLQEWLDKQVFPMEGKLTREDVYWTAILGIMEYLTSGITSNFDMYFFPMQVIRASVDCGFRTVQVGAVNDFVSSLEEMEECYHKVNAMSELTSYMIGFHAEYTTSHAKLKQIAALADRLHSPVYLHNSETALEVEECKKRYGLTPTQLTDALGMYKYGGGGYHCIYFDEKDIEIFAKRGLSVVTNPASNLKLASGIAPVKTFLDRGINVAIGTDGAASNNCLDMFREMFLTAGLAKVREHDAACFGADEVLYMATAGGAKAMGLTDCDCLAAGKKADLIIFDLKQPNMQPENNIVKNIVYSGSKQNVILTMVNGRILYENKPGEGMKYEIGFDPQEIYHKVNEIVRTLR